MIRLREIRERRGLTQIELSHMAGVSQSIISDIENDCVSPTIRVLQKLASALGVSVSDLLGESNKEVTA
ncbi:MAG: helix-turn-helix domain-containing protein [Alicyclobacillus sp.]|nr:helix-turn-helix domain-containing protein [Alicyclobacillus sp.]